LAVAPVGSVLPAVVVGVDFAAAGGVVDAFAGAGAAGVAAGAAAGAAAVAAEAAAF
jgi:hypothetical protein